MSLVLDQNELKTFSPSDAAIAQLAEEYMSLTIQDMNDKKAIAAVHSARMEVKRYRVDVEKKRKELKADALEYGRKVDSEAKRLTEMLLPIEQHLQGEEDRVQAELDRLKKEKEEAEAAKLQDRLDAMQAVNGDCPLVYIKSWSDEEFAVALADATDKFQAERERLAQEEADRVFREAELAAERRAEEERLAIERAELERQKAEMETDRKKQEAIRLAELKAEREELERQQAELAKQRAEVEAEKQRQEQERLAKEKAEREEQQRIERERLMKEAEAKRLAELEAERKRQEELRPDKEKLEQFADSLLTISIPSLSKKSKEAQSKVKEIMANAASQIRALI